MPTGSRIASTPDVRPLRGQYNRTATPPPLRGRVDHTQYFSASIKKLRYGLSPGTTTPAISTGLALWGSRGDNYGAGITGVSAPLARIFP